ncbi:hypothetical protein MKX01_000652 [Papaver californicum]|nr:hypothetical protein MKX01_000652 [Papaver californicum]
MAAAAYSFTLSTLCSAYTDNPYYVFSITAFLISVLTVRFLSISSVKKPKNSHLNLPPGPSGWPIVGNLFQVARSGKPFFEFVRDMRPKYGDIFALQMGSRTMIIVSSAELVHEALIEKGQIFATRPPENPTRNVYSCNKFTVNSALYGPVWRSLRRNMVQGMLSSSRLREFHGCRQSAMDRLIDRIRDEAKSNGGAVWVLKNARYAVFCILLSMCFGLEMDVETIDTIDQMMKKVLLILDPRLDDYLPILSPLFAKQRKHAMEVRMEQIETIVPFIEKRRSALQNPGSDSTAAPFAYLDTLFDLKVEGRKSAPNDSELVTLCSEFLNGGTDTTATALEWGIARLIDNPKIQSRLYDEIKSTVGDRKVEQKDLDTMVYLNAFIKELLRKHPPTYFSLTHAVIEPTTLGGYDIPPGANVEIYLPPISEDPRVWSDPKKFDPERFLSGKEEGDMTGGTGIPKMMPFGVGRRICPGLSMAMIHITLMVARMVQEFEWCSLPSHPKVDFSEKSEFTVVMKYTLQAIIKPRM